MDRLTPEQRSVNMSRIRGKDTKPELVVRRLAHSLGYRFRLHRRDLPGSPDLVFSGRRKVIFVHGCFWHGHGCKIGHVSRTRPRYWATKIERNKARDVTTCQALGRLGWSVLVVWECETRSSGTLVSRIRKFLDG